MHVLVLPKWWPARPDPQLGDFLRKQMLAVAALHGMSVVYACPATEPAGPLRAEVHESNGLWECVSYYRPSGSSFRPLRKAQNFLRFRKALRAGLARMARERGLPELIHAHILTRPVLAAWWYARKWKIPYVASEHASAHLTGEWGRKNALAKALDRFLFRRAACTTAVSPLLAGALEREGLGRRHRVVPNVLPGPGTPLPAPGPAGQFLVVADLVDRTKNISGVLRALAEVRGQGHDVSLAVIGDGPDREMLHGLAQSLGLGAQVHWHGRLPQHAVLPLMARAGTVIVNSNYETFSVVTGEALSLGKPVIATRCGGPEAFITGANGMLVPVGDVGALARAMAAMASEHARFKPAELRATLAGRFTAEAVAGQLDLIYRNAVAHG